MLLVGHRNDRESGRRVGGEAEGNLVDVYELVEAIDGGRSRSALVVFDQRFEFDPVDSALAVDLIHGR